MKRRSNKVLVPSARELRKSMTQEERQLWYVFLKDYPVRFLKQKVIGHYIVDFYCPEAKLVIELDGMQHYTKTGVEKDAERTAYLERFGLLVVRIQNKTFHQNFTGVCKYIEQLVKERI